MVSPETHPSSAAGTSSSLEYYNVAGTEKLAGGSVIESPSKSLVEPGPSAESNNGNEPQGGQRAQWSSRFFAYIKTREFWITLTLG